jgi:hypothetical protein
MPYNPSILSLIPRTALPGDDFDLSALSDTALGKIHYKNFMVESSRTGEQRFYSLTLGGNNGLDTIPIAGTGFGLKIMGDPTLSVHFRWEILRYVRGFKTEGFGFTEKAFFDLFEYMTGADKEEITEEIMAIFIDDADPFLGLMSHLSALSLPSGINNIGDLVAYCEANNVDLIGELFLKVIQGAHTLEEIWDNIQALFRRWLGEFTIEEVKDLLIPKVRVETGTIGVAIEFPRKVLLPLKADGTVIPEGDPDDKSMVKFPTVSLAYSTEYGFDFSVSGSGASLSRSQIGKTGIEIYVKNLKLDLSRKKNIAEADADGRPADFIGVYIGDAEFILPPKWFSKVTTGGTTLGIFAENVLIGTGGISGLFQLAAAGSPPRTPSTGQEMTFVFGKGTHDGDGRKGFTLGFKQFEIEFQQNQILNSTIKGSLTIPKFKKKGTSDSSVKLNIEAYFAQNGDFSITIDPVNALTIVLPGVFELSIDEMEIGRDDEKVYVQISGALDLRESSLLKDFFDEPFQIKKFRIYSDGSFEIEGGTIPLPDSIRMKVKPVEVYITAIHLGSHTQINNKVERKYKYIGLDAGISINPGGVKAEGDGMKYYFTVDGGSFHSFLRIEGLSIDLTIPGNASPDSAVLLLSGYLNMKEDEYIGGIKFSLPKAKIAGGAAMRYKPSVPAFLVDVNLELSTALPLGNTGLGIFGFRGLFGLRYIAAKDAVTPAAANWFEYYKAAPKKGIDVRKFKDLTKTPGGSTPFSIGAGISLATMSDDGKAFSSQLFLLLSIPNLILLEGKANILGKRLGIDDNEEPPFYAMIAYSPGDSVITGMGVNYPFPREGNKPGWIAKLSAEIEAAYYFKDSKAWYVNIGTKSKPVTAEILSLFNGYTYLMLSASGIEAGAGVHFAFSKNYCGSVVRASASAYFDVYGRVIFPRPKDGGGKEPTQFGGGVAVGGSVDVSLFGIGFYLGIAATLTGEAPQPFRVAGSVELAVAVKLVVKKIEKRFTVEFIWEKDNDMTVIRAAVPVLPEVDNAGHLPPGIPKPVGSVNIKSGRTYDIHYFGKNAPSESQITKTIPINTLVDLQFNKPVLPGGVNAQIGGNVNAPEGYEDLVPPAKGNRQAQHRYAIQSFKIEVLEGTTWEEYHPYKAMTNKTGAENYKAGYWQKTGNEYNKIRLLAQTPFNYMQQGQPEWYKPEQFGLTAATLLCKNTERTYKCAKWDRDTKVYYPGKLYAHKGLSLLVTGNKALTTVVPFNPQQQQFALQVQAPGTLELYLPEASVEMKVYVLASFPWQISVTWYAEIRDTDGNLTGYQAVRTDTKNKKEFPYRFEYKDDKKPVSKAVVTPSTGDKVKIKQLELEIEELNEKILNTKPPVDPQLIDKLEYLQGPLFFERSKSCFSGTPDYLAMPLKMFISNLQVQLAILMEEQQVLKQNVSAYCQPKLPKGPCVSAQKALAANQKRCELLQQEIDFGFYISAIPYNDKPAQCFYYVKEVCWLTERDHYYNVNIPAQPAIQADWDAMQDAIETVINPVWWPGKKYRVNVVVEDKVDTNAPTQWSIWYGFQTAQPFDGVLDRTKEQKAIDIQSYPTTASDYVQKKAEADLYRDDDGSELSLKYYIDFDKSYPEASGRLVYAKPLYYKMKTFAEGTKSSPALRLFFKDAHTHHFFNKWYDKNGIVVEEYIMDVKIKDPVEDIGTSNDATGPNRTVIEQLPLSEYIETQTNLPVKTPGDIQMLNNLLQVPGNCVVIDGGQLVPPKQTFITIQTDYLKPDKLYAAIISVNQVTGGGTTPWRREIHRYNFRTSRYKDLTEHVMSYRQMSDEGVLKDVVFRLNFSTIDINLILKIAKGISAPHAKLDAAYADPMDKIIFGLLKLGNLPAPFCTEFNFIFNGANLIAIWVRSPEPFNDPKMPLGALQDTVQLHLKNTVLNTKKMFSKDGTQVFIVPASGTSLPTSKISLEFIYMLLDCSIEPNIYQKIGDSVMTNQLVIPD